MNYPHELMAEMLMMTGLTSEQATANAVALRLMAGLKAAGLVPPQAEEIVARDARVVKLRGETLTMAVIAQRTGLPRCELYRAIRRHLLRRRAVLRLIA